MAVAYVQSGYNRPGTAATTVAVTLTGVTAGNLLVCLVSCGDFLHDITCADDKGNTWTAFETVDDDVTSGWRARAFYAKNVAAGDTVITGTLNMSSANRSITVHEISGCDTTAPLNVSSSQKQVNVSSSADATTSTADTTTADGCYIIGFSTNFSTGCTITSGAGFTIRQNQATGGLIGDVCSEDQVQSSQGSIAATFTNSGGSNIIATFMGAFKPAAGGASAVPPTNRLSLLGIG